jgi:hypothetical protein
VTGLVTLSYNLQRFTENIEIMDVGIQDLWDYCRRVRDVITICVNIIMTEKVKACIAGIREETVGDGTVRHFIHKFY